METRNVDAIRFDAEAIPPQSGIHWSAVFAGLAVGLSVHLLMMLIGIAAGFAVFGAGGRPDGESLSMAAAGWNTLNMLVSAFVGGYVAARCSALRRGSDGVLHGVVSWGATMLFFAVLTGSLTGNAVSGALGVASVTTAATQQPGGSDSTVGQLVARIERGDRDGAVSMLQERLGLTEEQAGRAVDEAMAMIGPGGSSQVDVRDAAQAASVVSTWLSAAILLSLLAAAGGGSLGARSTRRRALVDVSTTRRAPPPDMRQPPMTGPVAG